MVITDATQTGSKLGVEEAGAMNDWKLPTCAPQTGLACLILPGTQIAGEISIFWNFYIFVGCCLTSQSHSDGKCRSTFDVFDALATSPDDLS